MLINVDVATDGDDTDVPCPQGFEEIMNEKLWSKVLGASNLRNHG